MLGKSPNPSLSIQIDDDKTRMECLALQFYHTSLHSLLSSFSRWFFSISLFLLNPTSSLPLFLQSQLMSWFHTLKKNHRGQHSYLPTPKAVHTYGPHALCTGTSFVCFSPSLWQRVHTASNGQHLTWTTFTQLRKDFSSSIPPFSLTSSSCSFFLLDHAQRHKKH